MEMLWLGDSDGPKEACGGVHWRHLSNTIELSMCSGVVALHQITLTTCYYYYVNNVYNAVMMAMPL